MNNELMITVNWQPATGNWIRQMSNVLYKFTFFLQNKANLQKVKYGANAFITKDYGKIDTWSTGKNKAKTNPIQSQTNPILAQKRRNKPKTNPIFRDTAGSNSTCSELVEPISEAKKYYYERNFLFDIYT